MRKLIAIALLGVFAVSACSSAATAAPNTNQPTSSQAAGQPSSSQAVASDAVASPAAATDNTTTSDCGTLGYASGTYQGKVTHTFCGTGTATVKIGDKTYQFKNAQCAYAEGVGFAFNAGTTVIDMTTVPADGPQYFGVVALPNSAPMAVAQIDGHTYLDSTSATTVASDRKSGATSGTDLTDDLTFTATFTC